MGMRRDQVGPPELLALGDGLDCLRMLDRLEKDNIDDMTYSHYGEFPNLTVL